MGTRTKHDHFIHGDKMLNEGREIWKNESCMTLSGLFPEDEDTNYDSTTDNHDLTADRAGADESVHKNHMTWRLICPFFS